MNRTISEQINQPRGVPSSRLPSFGGPAWPLAIFIVCSVITVSVGYNQPKGMIANGLIGPASDLPRVWPIAVTPLLSLALAVAFVRKRSAFPTSSGLPAELSAQRTLLIVVLCSFTLSLLAVWALRAFPNSGDEYNYVFEAQTFLAGRLWNPLLPGHEFFSFWHIFEKDGKWVSQYSPGWPLLLAGFKLTGLPFWAVCPILGAALLFALAGLCRKEIGPAGAAIAVALTGLSPFFIFNAGSYFSHVPAALFGVLFCRFGRDFIDAPHLRPALLAGAALGVVGTIRTFDVFFFALPFAVELVIRARRDHWLKVPAMVLAGLPFLT